MPQITITSEVALQIAHDHGLGSSDGTTLVPVTDEDTVAAIDWLARLRLLDGVPFEYLVPDSGFLQPETIRFFHVDRNWTDAAVDGAIAAGAYGTRDRALVQAQHVAVRDALDDAERTVWGTTSTTGSTPETTGFLLRSRAVSGWPGMIVRAWTGSGRNERKLQPLRIERLSPSVLIVLFDDEPARLEIEEPRAGLQFGFHGHDTIDGRWSLTLRDTDGTLDSSKKVDSVPFRAGSAGVVHIERLTELIAAEVGAGAPPTTSASLAFHLLRKPYVQRFGEGSPSGISIADLLAVSIAESTIVEWHR